MRRDVATTALPRRERRASLQRKRRKKIMPRIANIETGFYRIPLPVTLSDSTHGDISAFELITCRIRDADGAEGAGYTYTVGRNGGAVADILRREIPALVEGREADDTEAIWHQVWWALHYGGRRGRLLHIRSGDLRSRC